MDVKVDQTLTEVTPEILAKAFWEMDAEGQADFFGALYEEVEKTREELKLEGGYGFVEMQWLYMADKIKKRDMNTRSMFYDFCSHAYDFWPQRDY